MDPSKLFGKLLGKRSAPRDEEKVASSSSSSWKVIRLAAKSQEQRTKEGGDFKSRQQKVSCQQLDIFKDGVKGKVSGFFSSSTIVDYNNYRTQGHSGRFEARTNDRAVSVGTLAAYESFQSAFGAKGAAKVEKGDLGENILISGPSATATNKGESGLFVGAKIKVGTAILELTEANNPCYRFNAQTWAPDAKKVWGETAPEGNAAKWFKSPDCPLNHEVNPGVRGWLARVIKEGSVKLDDDVGFLTEEEVGEGEDNAKRETSESPAKRLKPSPQGGN